MMTKINILLVDDEAEFITTLAERMQLRNLPSQYAFNGDQALQMVAAFPPDVMILDLKMPGIDGMEVLRRVKKEYPRIEVIILTGHGAKKDEDEARRLGAFEYLKKPVDIDELTQHIKKAYQYRISMGY
jgi:two-component system response regulator (stage 0 sporulation protein F)